MSSAAPYSELFLRRLERSRNAFFKCLFYPIFISDVVTFFITESYWSFEFIGVPLLGPPYKNLKVLEDTFNSVTVKLAVSLRRSSGLMNLSECSDCIDF